VDSKWSHPADLNEDGGVDGADVQAFFDGWENTRDPGDVNHVGGIDGSDVQFLIQVWEAGAS